MTEEHSSAGIKWESGTEIAVPPPASERRIAIRAADWTRLTRLLGRCSMPSTMYSDISSVLFGTSGSAALTLIPLYLSKAAGWVLSIYWCVFLFAGAVGIAFAFVARREKTRSGTDLSVIREEMEEIEKAFPKDSPSPETVNLSTLSSSEPALRRSALPSEELPETLDG